MAENHQLHRDTCASEVLLCLCATTNTVVHLDSWLGKESKGEADPLGTKTAVRAVALLGPM